MFELLSCSGSGSEGIKDVHQLYAVYDLSTTNSLKVLEYLLCVSHSASCQFTGGLV